MQGPGELMAFLVLCQTELEEIMFGFAMNTAAMKVFLTLRQKKMFKSTKCAHVHKMCLRPFYGDAQ